MSMARPTERTNGHDTPVGDEPHWVTLADSSRPADEEPGPISRGRVLAPIIIGSLLVGILVAVSGSIAASRLAEKESVNDAAKTANVLAEAVVQPALTDGLVTGDKQAFAAMDKAVRGHVLGTFSVRVKIWSAEGKVVYSDDPTLVGKTFALGDEEREVFTRPATRAEVSDLQRPENTEERGQGKLLEVYRPVWTPSGEPLLFETYAPYDGVTSRADQIWRGFAGITVSSLLALIVLMMPVVWRLVSKVRRAQQQREQLLERAVEASNDERRRIAGTLHDGVVQELAGASFVVAGAATKAAAVGQDDLARQLREAAGTVRSGIGGMRTLLVDLYPPNLETSGLAVALEDLTTSLRSRDVAVEFDLDPQGAANLDADAERLVYRVAHECLLNCMRHAQASRATVALRYDDGDTVLEVSDDGVGFDPEQALAHPCDGHFGIRILGDVVRAAGADLRVASAPGEGTRWQLRVPSA
jgi:signal transduction histidine kinase